MTNDKKKAEEEKNELTKKILENEQLSDDLQLEYRKRQEELDESHWRTKQQADRLAILYQELVHFGDKEANVAMDDVQDISRRVQAAFRSQEATFEEIYRKAKQQLEDQTETFRKERGKVTW